MAKGQRPGRNRDREKKMKIDQMATDMAALADSGTLYIVAVSLSAVIVLIAAMMAGKDHGR
jgi:hypothetical protein